MTGRLSSMKSIPCPEFYFAKAAIPSHDDCGRLYPFGAHWSFDWTGAREVEHDETEFYFLDEMLPGIRWDAKYATWDNFYRQTGGRIWGKTVLGEQKELGAALTQSSKTCHETGIWAALMGWVIAPQACRGLFSALVSLPENNLTKNRYYPNIKRNEMVTRDMWPPQSSHSRGEVRLISQFFI